MYPYGYLNTLYMYVHMYFSKINTKCIKIDLFYYTLSKQLMQFLLKWLLNDY